MKSIYVSDRNGWFDQLKLEITELVREIKFYIEL